MGLKHDSSRNSNILLVAFQRIDEVKKSVSIRIAVLLISLKPKIHRNIWYLLVDMDSNYEIKFHNIHKY